MLTASEVSDRVDNNRPSAAEIANHFASTIFWNWSGDVERELDAHLVEEYPLTVLQGEPDEEGNASASLIFESGEATITVAEMSRSKSDDSATLCDAHFVANLPVYIPELFRTIRKLQSVRDAALKLLPYLPTEIDAMNYAATNDGRCSPHDVAAHALRQAVHSSAPPPLLAVDGDGTTNYGE